MQLQRNIPKIVVGAKIVWAVLNLGTVFGGVFVPAFVFIPRQVGQPQPVMRFLDFRIFLQSPFEFSNCPVEVLSHQVSVPEIDVQGSGVPEPDLHLVKEQINLPEAAIVDNSGQPVTKGASVGTTDDGSHSELISQNKKFPKSDAITLRQFLSAIDRKLKEKGLKGKNLASVNVETTLDGGVAHDGDAAPPQSAQ